MTHNYSIYYCNFVLKTRKRSEKMFSAKPRDESDAILKLTSSVIFKNKPNFVIKNYFSDQLALETRRSTFKRAQTEDKFRLWRFASFIVLKTLLFKYNPVRKTSVFRFWISCFLNSSYPLISSHVVQFAGSSRSRLTITINLLILSPAGVSLFAASQISRWRVFWRFL